MTLAAVTMLAGCGDESEPPGTIATFRVADEEFKIELVTADLVAHAEALLAGETMDNIPLGTVVRDGGRCEFAVVMAHRPADARVRRRSDRGV